MRKLTQLDTGNPHAVELPSLHQSIYWFSVTVHSRRRIYITGGNSFERVTINRVFFFDILSNGWNEAPKLNKGRYRHSSIVLADKIYVVGGIEVFRMLSRSIEMLDLCKN